MSTAEFAIWEVRTEARPAASGLRHRYLAVAVVGLVHLLVLWIFVAGIRPGPIIISNQSHELQVRVLSPNLGPPVAPYPPLDWTFDAPETVVIPEPQIAITPDQEAGEGIVGSAITQRLAPRLDPKHVNARPQLPHTLGGIIRALSVELRILVLPDGTVGDTHVVRTAGDGDIDRLAMETVRKGWRYLPASINGKPIEAWTTVVVRFSAF